ncbi:MAG: DUF2723 domain-containing protein [Vicingaceae bacterium]
MPSFSKLNNYFAWFTFAIAAFVYLSTIEPTTSFWDCGEFIATAYKLEVGHPPGAPLFMLIARAFSMLVPVEHAALMVNAISGLCSAFTILFLFWTITLFVRKIALKDGEEMSRPKMIAILGSGLVGGLAYTFSDTFWFSAVEGEVYSMSSLFTAVAFYAMLKWESVADRPHSKRWIIVIAYFIGLSVGVHLLSLLTIPAITFIYYFKRHEVTPKGLLKASAAAVIILGSVQYGIIPGIVSLASKFELIFVNGMGMPFSSGIVIYAILLISLIVYGLKWSHDKGKVALNTAILAFAVIVIGYSSYSVIVIRSNANPPMDENNPENVFALLSYLNREQYGDKPFLYGQYFNTPLDPQRPYKDGDPVYYKDEESGKYIIVDDKKNSLPNYDSKFMTFFPRMWSPQGKHIRYYKKWSNFEGKPIRTKDQQGKVITLNKPTFGENLTFFFRYQMGWMWGRYFMWNFAGRQNDIQGHGGITHGNWISGIPFIDSIRLGNQSKLPMEITTNKAHNKFYMLPLILGLFGAWYQFKHARNNAIVVTLLFFFTGMAILIFLNNYPLEPRERDYAVVGSFYAFSIWIGLGVYALFDLLKDKIPVIVASSGSVAITLLAVPVLMASEGWDDHTRARRYTGRDYAKNYLNSCAPNAILFTNGDNDTFPLWYVQEVEEYRTDVRVVNLSLANTDWYIEQMKRAAYDSEPIPSSIPDKKYRTGTNDYLPIVERFEEASVKQVIDWVVSDNGKTKIQVTSGKNIDYIPTKNLKINIDKNDVIRKGVVKPEDSSKIVSEITWKIKKNYILKNDLMILDILATNDWKRPVYFASTAPSESYLGLEDYFQTEGLAYRLVPIKTPASQGQPGRVNTEVLYDNVMNKFVWGGLDKDQVYMDENNRRMTISLRLIFSRLAEDLTRKGEKDRAKEVLDRCMEVVPENNVPFDLFTLYLTENYYMIDDYEQANYMVRKLADLFESNLEYYNSLDAEHKKLLESENNQTMAVLQRLWFLTNQQYPQEELGKELDDRFGMYFRQPDNQQLMPQNQ